MRRVARSLARSRGQSGAILPLVLAATLVGGLVVAALVSLVFTNVRSTHAYQGRTDTVGRANDAINCRSPSSAPTPRGGSQGAPTG